MPTRLNRAAYEKLIAEDLEWLLAQPRSLEREHIEAIVRRSADHEYAGTRPADQLVRALALLGTMPPAERAAFFAAHPEAAADLGLNVHPARKHRVLTVPDDLYDKLPEHVRKVLSDVASQAQQWMLASKHTGPNTPKG